MGLREEFLFFYKSVIYDIPDEQFERGLKEFQVAVQTCCEKSGVFIDFCGSGVVKTPIPDARTSRGETGRFSTAAGDAV